MPPDAQSIKAPQISATFSGSSSLLPGYGPAMHRPLFCSSPSAGVALATDFIHGAHPTTFLLQFDLKAGRDTGRWNDPSNSSIVDVSLDGTRAILLGGTDPRTKDRIQILDLSASPPKVLVATKPYSVEDSRQRGIKFASLVDDEHLLTADNDYRIVLWQIPEMKPVYSHRFNFFPNHALWEGVALSPDRKYLVTEEWDLKSPASARFSSEITFFDALSGQGCGGIPHYVPADYIHLSSIDNQFSPDGKFFLHKYGGGITVFSLSKEGPTKVLDVGQPAGIKDSSMSSVLFADPGFLLINDKYLFDIDKQFVIWRYEGFDPRRYGPYGDSFLASNPHELDTHQRDFGQRFVKVIDVKTIHLPEPETMAAVTKADPAKTYVIVPGDKVTVDVHLSNDPSENQRIAEAFAKQLQDNGMIVADDQPIKLEVTQETLNHRDVVYRGVTNRNVGGVAHIDSTEVKVAFKIGGNVVWENHRINGGAPLLLTIKPGESLDQAVAAKRPNTPVVDFILPKRVPAPRDPIGFGVTDMATLMKNDAATQSQ